ncbi:RNA pseudouridine synthase [Candidatus Aerophobetes bacterium]|uniref:RNA pseudouridine synthase n=1 Tax=Aerophobetes bacterium TaxID=2030807 RepID=A0A2A4YF85_UNCAE|nr:MAG: RNA pseudouridine synthase [Candidatus Aerophobetes bacterium]
MATKASKSATVLEILKGLYPDSSNSTLKKWIKHKRVYVDSLLILRSDYAVTEGMDIELDRKKSYFKEDIEILYEDPDISVIHKPMKLLSVATDSEKTRTAHDLLKTRYIGKRVYPVHRLDYETSGVMVFALTKEARESLKKQFEERSTTRVYEVIVENEMTETKGKWEHFLREDGNYKMHITKDEENAKKAITFFETIELKKGRSFLRCTLHTGRKNQIRVQAANAGYPVIGDTKYGAKTNPIARLGLHAATLGFAHPRSGKKFSFSYKTPLMFQRLFKNVDQ